MKIQATLISFVVFILLLAALPAWAMFSGNNHLLIPHFWAMFAFITGLTLLVVVALLVTQKINPENYAQTFLAVTVFKLLVSLAFVVVFILKNKVEKTIFAADFFYLYFLNMAFEVYVLLRNLRNQNLK
ncbi:MULTISPECIES: hypothetical protein [unclassified Mucilaginibacter]|uniref:hypothetical protein n=1 Tax=unclassified Mucilaginibacter TaxID=2617802 RepID=UPI00138C4153|nr:MULTISPECIES: hypothetical protein [unclassified Mucilaginibacter]MBB5397902.1 uncharacterized membrane protein YozB (DUF420 family) [Mucilaginibacter sp. AK015]QHS55756.1 hypothetical protein GWR56_09500 [Mucilaginibacter sp. 14171R-50]